MLLSAVSVLVVAQSSSEIPEGLMNNPVYISVKYHSIPLHSYIAMPVSTVVSSSDEHVKSLIIFL